MALVTLQRSPSPSNDPDEESAEGTEEGSEGKSSVHRKRSKSTLERLRKIFSTVRFISKLRPCLSESYFTVKGAALILPHSDLNRKTSRKNHGGEIQRHLQSMLYLLRPEDKIKVAIRLESPQEHEHRYMALVSTMGRQDTEECVLLGMDCTASTSLSASASTSTPSTPPSSPTMARAGAVGAGHLEGRGMGLASVGMVLPIWMGMKIRLNGDGGFAIVLDDKSYLFKPVSVQAMWTALHSMDRALYQAELTKYLPDGLTHTWVEYYRSKVDHSNQSRVAAWHLMEDVVIFAPENLNYSNENETEKVKMTISAKLKEVMMTVDLDEATCRSLRLQVEEALNMKLDEYRNYFDEELIRILGQMDAPSQILDHLYLGSEWNASNLEELQQLGIKYILNITREIDNFFTGMFHYCNVRLYDQEDSELMKHWLKTYKFINKARKHGSKVLVHCKMGISRSASTVIAYIMKENRWSLDKAFAFVKERRSCIRPNKGFMEQLQTYEGILNASNKRDIFRSKSEHDIMDAVEGEEAEGGQQGAFLGDSLFRMMSGCDWTAQSLSPEEEILLRKSMDHNYSGMEPDMETDSRSADSMEESLPDMPSPVAEQPPGSLQLRVPAAKPAGEKRDNSRPSSQVLAVDASGAVSRIKSDTSWIKLEVPGESTTDPVAPEAMEVKEPEDQTAGSAGKDTRQEQPSDSVRVVSESATETEMDVSSQLKQDVCNAKQMEDAGGGTPDQKGSVSEVGIHQYYNREQIPWNPGTVRNLREGFCPIDQNAPTTSSDTAAKCPDTPTAPSVAEEAEQTRMESEKSVVDGAVHVDTAVPAASQSSGGEGLAGESSPSSAVEGQAAGGEESMETDELARSVYEREDIRMMPGTVRRTLQQIEERQKLHQGDDLDSGMKSVRRSSSLREERGESNKERESERRKTCTPIVSPPPEKAGEMEGDGLAGEALNIEAAMLKLDHQVGESSTDDVEMEAVEKEEGATCEEEVPVTVYTYGEESVPVKAGIVRRQKQEIEKSWEASGGHQRSLSMGSVGSVTHAQETADTVGCWSPDHHPEAMFVSSEGVTGPYVASDLAHAHSIPTSTLPWASSPPGLPEGLHPKQPKTSLMDTSGTEGAFPAGAGGECRGSEDRTRQQLTPRKPGKDSSTEGGRGDSRLSATSSHAFERHRHHSDSSEEDHWAETAAPRSEGTSAFRPYAHSFPASRKHGEKSHYDAKTLAMIREIGSAFVSSPPRREEDNSQDGATSLVKHLVKNIEKETKVAKPERKIVIINSEASQDKKHARTESGSSLFSPSPEFLTNIERQLSQSSQQQPASHGHPPGGSVPSTASKNVPESSSDSCTGLTHCPSSAPSSAALGEGSEQAPSVVKHLRGRFEGGGLQCDGGEGEVPGGSTASHGSAPASRSLPACHDCEEDRSSVVMREKKQPGSVRPSSSGFTQSRSLEEPPVCDSSEPFSSVSHPQAASSGPSAYEPSRFSRRPRSADHVAFYASRAPGCGGGGGGGGIPRVQAPWYREAMGSDTQEQDVSDGVKVRKLHGKSHPLSRLQQQGKGPFPPPSLQRHSPFHSSM